jgi:hypothetical protein
MARTSLRPRHTHPVLQPKLLHCAPCLHLPAGPAQQAGEQVLSANTDIVGSGPAVTAAAKASCFGLRAVQTAIAMTTATSSTMHATRRPPRSLSSVGRGRAAIPSMARPAYPPPQKISVGSVGSHAAWRRVLPTLWLVWLLAVCVVLDRTRLGAAYSQH